MNIPASSHYVIKTDRLFTPDELRGTFWVEIEAGRIKHSLTEQPSGIEVLDATGFLVAPGFIDVHIHGYGSEQRSSRVYGDGSAPCRRHVISADDRRRAHCHSPARHGNFEFQAGNRRRGETSGVASGGTIPQ
jgi:imidazolonepropionase-like amidohydrolase